MRTLSIMFPCSQKPTHTYFSPHDLHFPAKKAVIVLYIVL